MTCDVKMIKMNEQKAAPKKRVCIVQDVEIKCSEDVYKLECKDLELVPDAQNILPEKRRNSVKVAIKVEWNKMKKVYSFDISITKLSFKDIKFTDDCVFYIRASVGPKPADNVWNSPLTETVLSVTDKLTGNRPVKFDVAFKQFGLQRSPVEKETFRIVVEAIPFVIPRVPANHWLLFLMFNSFSELVVQIDKHCDDWPFISWIRQNQTTKDASVPELYDRLFGKCRDFDFDDFKEGVTFERVRRPFSIGRTSALELAIANQDQFSCDVNASGIPPTKFFNFAQRMTKAFADECGYTYQVLASTPKHRVHIADKTDLIAYVPVFERDSYVVADLVGNDNVVYRLYALIREEEGQYTATYYSPKTKKFYDIRNGTVTPLDRTPPPMCNSREQYLFLLYVHNDLNFYMTPFKPIMPFMKKHNIVDVYEYGENGMNNQKSLVSELPRDDLYFSYHPDNNKHPTYPLDSISGDSVLRIKNQDSPDDAKVLAWTLSNTPILTPLSEIPKTAHSINERYVCIRDEYRIVDICTDASSIPSPLFKVPVTQLHEGATDLCVVHFTKAAADGTLCYTRYSTLVIMDKSPQSYEELLKHLQVTGKYEILGKTSSQKLLRIPNSDVFCARYEKFRAQSLMELFVNEL